MVREDRSGHLFEEVGNVLLEREHRGRASEAEGILTGGPIRTSGMCGQERTRRVMRLSAEPSGAPSQMIGRGKDVPPLIWMKMRKLVPQRIDAS